MSYTSVTTTRYARPSLPFRTVSLALDHIVAALDEPGCSPARRAALRQSKALLERLGRVPGYVPASRPAGPVQLALFELLLEVR